MPLSLGILDPKHMLTSHFKSFPFPLKRKSPITGEIFTRIIKIGTGSYTPYLIIVCMILSHPAEI